MTWQALGPFMCFPAAVFPLDDLRSHEPDNENCWCGPSFDGGVLVHRSMDRREEHEQERKMR